MASALPLPRPGVVHIWYAHLDPPQPIVAGMEKLLAPDEWTRMGRFYFADHARRYAVRRGVLRHLLAAYLNERPQEIAFAYGAQKKPALAKSMAAVDLRFNLSDSGEMAVYAFTRGHDLGVDIEADQEYPDALKLAERFFSDAESTWLAAQPVESRSHGFLRCWTCKEAVIKASGEGLTAPLHEFSVAHWLTPPQLIWRGSRDAQSSIHLLHPPTGYTAALAVSAHVESIQEATLHFD